MGYSSTPSIIPVVDLDNEIRVSGLHNDDWISKSNVVRRAMEEYGCFIVKYGSISPDSGIRMESELKELFDLPLDTKKKNHFDNEPLRGYVSNIATLPLYEATGIDKATLEGIQQFSDLMWPDQGNPKFCQNVHSLSTIMNDIVILVTQMVFSSYGLLKYYAACVDQMDPNIRVARYRVPNSSNETNLGLIPHLDTSFVSLLYQNNTNGIEIESATGEWLGVDLQSPSSFLFMAGEGLMAWSNGRINAANHRVNMTGKTKPRYSCAMFTNLNGPTKTPEELVDEEHPLRFKPYIHEEYLHAYYEHRRGPNKGIYTLETYCGINDIFLHS
ncbi:unnamed protein product [Rhodiola kirilowii]